MTPVTGRDNESPIVALFYIGGMDTGPSDVGENGQVIWTREIEYDKIRARTRKFWLYFMVPTAIVLLLGFVIGGVGAFLGLGILLALFGLLLGGLVFFKNLGAKQNATIERDGGELVCGRRRIDLGQIESWTTVTRGVDWGVTSQAVWGNPMAGNAITAEVIFRVAKLDVDGDRVVGADGASAVDLVRISWAEMPSDQIERLRQTLAVHIAAPHLPAGEAHS